jgi:type II secretory pathway pseudopilin PulG
MKIEKKAYSLVELSIVIIVLATLISGALSFLADSANNAKIKITKDRMEQIYSALGNFLLVNNRLPCPASIIAVKTSNTTYGTEGTAAGTCTAGGGVYASSTSTNLVYGMVPVRTLGLSNEFAEDGFEDKIAYIIDKRFTKATSVPDAGVDSFGTSPSASIITINEIPGSATQTDTSDAIFALISYGSNKNGAFGINSASQNTRSTDSSEMENDISSSNDFNNILISDAANSDIFDDIVFYKTRNIVVSDFNAFTSVPCPATSLSITYGTSGSYSWSQSNYNQVVASTTQCPSGYRVKIQYPTIICGPLGIWRTTVINNCSSS